MYVGIIGIKYYYYPTPQLQILYLEDARLQSVEGVSVAFRAEADPADDCALSGQLTLITIAHEMLNRMYCPQDST